MLDTYLNSLELDKLKELYLDLRGVGLGFAFSCPINSKARAILAECGEEDTDDMLVEMFERVSIQIAELVTGGDKLVY